MRESSPKLTRDELLFMLAQKIDTIDRLPNHAKFSFVTNADLAYVLSILYGLLDDEPSPSDSAKDL